MEPELASGEVAVADDDNKVDKLVVAIMKPAIETKCMPLLYPIYILSLIWST